MNGDARLQKRSAMSSTEHESETSGAFRWQPFTIRDRRASRRQERSRTRLSPNLMRRSIDRMDDGEPTGQRPS